MAKCLVLLTLDHKVTGSNPTGGGIQLMTIWHFISKSLLLSPFHRLSIGIKHGFSGINICQVPWEVLKTEAKGRAFQHLPRDLANVNALKNHV